MIGISTARHSNILEGRLTLGPLCSLLPKKVHGHRLNFRRFFDLQYKFSANNCRRKLKGGNVAVRRFESIDIDMRFSKLYPT